MILHVTCFECFGALGASAVSTQESDVPSSLHADAAAVRLLNLQNLRLEIAQAVRRRLPRRLLREENFAVHRDALVDDRVARQALLHPQPAVLAADLMVARLEGDHQADLIAHDALLRCLQLRLHVEWRRRLRCHVNLLRDVLLATDVL